MAAAGKVMTMADEVIVNKIYLVRGQKVMIDRDLAELYGVETKVLKQAVRRNISRFPPDFLFQLNKKELEHWRTQIASSNPQHKMGLRYAPFCFTEQGVTMLSCVLNSERAIEVNIRIIRVFIKMREMLSSHKDILVKLEQIEKKLFQHDMGMNKHQEDVQLIFQALKQLLNPPQEPRTRIGFRRPEEQD